MANKKIESNKDNPLFQL